MLVGSGRKLVGPRREVISLPIMQSSSYRKRLFDSDRLAVSRLEGIKPLFYNLTTLNLQYVHIWCL